MKHFENKDFGIWYELFQNQVKLFIKGCDEDENQSQYFQWILRGTFPQGRVTFNDG